MRALSSLSLLSLTLIGAMHHTTAAAFSSGLRKTLRPTQCCLFPGAIPITDEDKETCANQTGQDAPSNALVGKPSKCRCKHGYPQAFSLDPVPPTQQFKRSSINRVNSGLLKLTCPLVVNAIDILEDEGFIDKMNSMLVAKEGEELSQCMDGAHAIHSSTRKKLIFGEEETSDDNENFQMLKSKLSDKGAEYFLNAGVASANPLSKRKDVKCLHAWLADYLFRIAEDEEVCEDGMTSSHPIGEAILAQLKERGIDSTGTDSCYQVCSGGVDTEGGDGAVTVPIARNKQRKKKDKEIERRRRQKT